MDSRLRQGLCNLPTKQNYHSLEKDTPLPYHNKRRNSPLSTNCDGPNHRTPTASRIQCYTNYSRPWMLPCSHLPTMFRHDHRPWNRPTILRLCLLMVRATHKNDKRPRSQVHLSVWQSAHGKPQHPAKPIYGIPPPDRWTLRTKEPMGGTIPTVSNLKRP